MNFQELYNKIRQIDESPELSVSSDEVITGECGDMMPTRMSAPAQQDSVTMNISMNGNGAGGIRDLMDILRNLDGDVDSDATVTTIGEPELVVGMEEEEFEGGFKDATTKPGETMLPHPDSGEDLHREKDEYPKVNGGGNPMRENLVTKLQSMYLEIKGQ
jgi:hypothetical protein